MSDYLTIADLGDLYIATFDARIKWRNFLLVLKISSDTIDSIGTKWRDDPDDCYREGLKEWLKGGERSWEDVVKALSSPIVGHSDIARTIEKDHLQSTDASNPTDVKSEVDENHQKINDDLTVFLDELLGKGAFGAVFKGSYRGKICAVKLLIYEAVEIQTGFPTGKSEEASKAFDRECEFLQSLQHPNVVLYLSTAKHPKSGGTILVVELMDCNLRSYFSSLGEESLTSECEISLSKDMACGLAYIHSKKIIHRDLCGDNVLLKLTQPVPIAKISDFGMSRLYDPSKLSHTLTAIGHRMGYLPLEAIRLDKENYDNSVDVFSLGVIMVQIVQKLKTVKSVEDRSFHVAQIPHTHRLRKLIDSCLQEDMRRRPSARDIYSSLTSDSDTVEATKREFKDTQVNQLLHQVSEKDTHSQASIDRLQAEQVCGLEEVTTPQQEQFEVQPREIDHLVKFLQIQPRVDTQPDNNLTADVDLTSGSDPVEETKRESKDPQPVKKAHGGQTEHKDAELVRRDAIIQQQRLGPPPRELRPPLTLKWRIGKYMPIKMSFSVQSVVIGDTVYVGGGIAYGDRDKCTVMKLEQDQWTKLPEYTAYRFAMTSLANRLVLVGGHDSRNKKPTNQLAVFESGEWTHPYPPMNIARYSSTAVSFNNHIIVAGGCDDKVRALSSVEVLDVASRRWYIAQSLPNPRSVLKSTLIGNTLYLMGGYNHTLSATKTVYHVDLTELVAKAHSNLDTPTLWQTLQEVPLVRSAPLSIGRSLLAVGGWDDNVNPSSLIHLYQPDTRRWVKVGDLPTARLNCTCSVLPSGEVIVAGGQTDALTNTQTVDFFSISAN
ncbi:uncharacterized protein LOC135352068 isoform X3 [Halichondria panicea]|uniref:uncharacterized protein LOC135352068 isoform X3 n=1 Tax=Halichondria panicea TaxID=6063 RepID=UPI00312BBCE3